MSSVTQENVFEQFHTFSQLFSLKHISHLVPYNSNNSINLRTIFTIIICLNVHFITIETPIDTPYYIKKNVIGRTADIIQWTDDSFRMDILPGSFTKGYNVDILVSMHSSHQFVIPKGYKLLSQTYQILVSEKLQQPLTITIKHNAVISAEEEAKSLVILHRNDEGETEILQGYTEPNSSFITFQLTELSPVAAAGPNNTYTKYFLSFYRQKTRDDRNPSVKILVLISQSEPRHEVFYAIDISL